MNRIYRLRWNRALARWVVTSELARRTTRGRSVVGRTPASRRARTLAGVGLSLAASATVWAGPTGGQVTSGTGQISQSGNTTTVQQNSQTLSLNWQSFNVGTQETVNFVQPDASSIAVNRILSATASEILGHLNANGQVWLINPNGMLFGRNAQVNVGGLVASTLDSLDDSATDTHRFSGDGSGSIINQGTITAASGGYVALMGHQVSNQGAISAQLGTVALGAGSAQTLTFSGNHLLHLQVDQSELNDLVENRQVIQANGGQVIMTAGARDSLLASLVNNTGVVQAETVENHGGSITLLGGEQAGTVNVAGTLDASAPHGGNGGAIETSGARVDIAGTASIEAGAPSGRAGTWLVDPTDLTIDSAAATTIDNALNSGTNVTEQTTASGATGAGQTATGPGDINVNAAISWTNPAASLTLTAYHGINVNATVSGAGQVTMDAAGANLTLSSGSSVSGQAGVTLGTGANFVNNAGASAVSAGSGARWLVYSTDPTLDTTGGLAPDFIQYNTTFAAAPTPASGSGFLYSVAPTLSVTALSGTVTKTYDGTTTATLAGSNMSVSGLLNGDTVTAATGTYASANAGNNIDVTSPTTATALAVTTSGGATVYGYALSSSTVTAAIGTISQAQLSAAIVGNPTKVYDGTTTATLSQANYALSGFVGSEGASVGQPSSVAYDAADAGPRTITATFTSTNFTANSGTSLSNYVLPTSAVGAGTVTQAPLNLTGLLANNKIYDGTTTASLNTSNAGIFGVIAPDVADVSLNVSGASGTFASANVGNGIGVTPSGFTLTGTKAPDYELIAPSNLTANISPKSLSVTGVAATSKVYDGTTADTLALGSAQLSGVVASDSGAVTLSSGAATGTFSSANVGSSIGVTASGFTIGGLAASNYTLAQPNGLSASITQAPLTITFGGNPTKPYNGTTTAVVPGSDFTISGFISGQSATVAQNAQAEYASANAGTNVGLTATLEPSDLSTGSGTLLSNYSFPHSVSGTGTINPAALTGYINNNPTKTYDGTTAGTVTSGDYVLSGFVGSESITVNQPSGTYASANAGPETITASLTNANYTAGSGTLLSNYVLPTSLSGSGTILPQPLGGNYINGSIVNNPTKPYDGTTTATLTPSNFQLTGFVGSDGAIVTQTVGQYAGVNVGSQNVTAHLTGSNFTAEGSTNLSNYVLPSVLYGTGTIVPAVLTATIVGDPTKVYDGTTTAVLIPSNYQVSGFANGEGVTVNPSSLINYASKNVGAEGLTAALTPSAFTANSGTLLSNYVLPTSATGGGTITAAPLYVTGVSAANKVYDTTTAATLNVGSAGLAGLVSGDAGAVTLTTSTSGTFSQPDVGTALPVTTAGFSISGSGASNYTLQPVTGLHANITPAPLTVSGVSANSKSYDDTSAATLNTSTASLVGVLNSDNVTLSTGSAAGTFASVNVGTQLPVTATGFGLGGTKSSDYQLSQPTGLSADITPQTIIVTITGNPTKPYDGSSSATLTASDYTLSGFVNGQSATLPQSATASYLTANAGTNVGLQSTLVTSDYIAGTGTNLSNYSLPTTASGSLGTITPKVLNLSGTRVYDATTDANGTLFGTVSGLNGDTLTVTGDGTLNSKNVGTEGFSSLGSLTLSAGGTVLASNYTLVGGTDWVNITPAVLTVNGTTAASKVYDGTTVAALSGATLAGVIGLDSVTLENDVSGAFSDKNVGTGKTVTTAMTVTGTDAGNYIVTQPGGLTADITAKSITVSATGVNKVYDGNVNDAATLASSGVISGDSISFTDTAATFADANVANGKTVSVSGISASGTDAGNYLLNNTTATTTANITPAVLNLTGTRVYDADTDASATLFGTGGLLNGVNGETLTLTGTGTLASKNVNTAQTFASLAGFTLTGNSGAQASNYTFSGGTDSVDITKAPLTVLGTSAASKTYDGTTAAALSGATLTGVFSGDTVNLGNYTTGTFNDKNVGVSKPVSTAMTINGTDSGNYSLAQPTGLTADITQLSITVAATGTNRAYTGGVNDAVTLSSSGVVSGDSISFTDTAATFADANVANGKTVSVSGIGASGTDAGNYLLNNTTASTTANITPAILSLSGTRVYDADTDAAATLFGSSGVLNGVNGETLTLSGTGTLSSKNVSAAQTFSSLAGFGLTGNGSAQASNYTLVGGTDSVDITKLPITVAATGANKVYDGGLTDPGVTLASAGILGTDAVNFADTSATFANKNVGTGTTVTVSGITSSGADAGNYSINTTATTTANITPKTIIVSATGTNKVYDGSVTDVVTLTASGVISGDTLGFSDTSATFADANVGNAKAVSISGISASGTAAGNYTVNTTATTTANITPDVLSLTGTRVYDANTDAAASLFGTVGVLNGVNGETLTLSGTGTLTSKNVSAGQTFSSLTGFSLTGDAGAQASNYTLVGGTDSVAITKLPITVTATGANKVYNANTADRGVALASTGVLGTDVVNFSDTSATFSDKNVGVGKTVTVTGITATGSDASNYTINSSATGAANITPAPLTVTGTIVAGKVYDGSSTAALSGSTLTGVLSGDSVTLANAGTGTFSDPNAGTGKSVTTTMTVNGMDAGNYALSQPTGLTANITPVTLSLSGTRVYDANTDASAGLFGTDGILSGVNGETLTLGGVGTLTSKDVNPSQTFASLSGFTLTGDGSALASNYTFVGGTDSVAITPRNITVTATGVSKVYDSTTADPGVTLASTGVLTGDAVNFSDTSATFADKNVGTGKTVTVVGIGAGGADSANYTFNSTTTTTANITPAPLTVLGTQATSKVYDGTTAAALSGAALSGVFNGDSVLLSNDSSGSFGDKNVGSGKSVTTAMSIGGMDAGNYALFQPSGLTANITPKSILVAATGTDKVYDGSVTDAVILGSSGVVSGDSINFADASATFGDKNVGVGKAVAVSGISATGTDAGNYTFNTTATTDATITARPILVTAAGTDKVYDSTTTDPGVTLASSGVLAGDTVNFSDTSATFSDKNVGSGKTVTVAGIGASGADAADYSFNGTTTTNASITPAPLTVLGTQAASKVYDGTTSASLSGATLSGVFTGDTVLLASDSIGSFANQNAGTGKSVTTSMTLGGTDAGNYTLAQPAGLTANITPSILNLAGTRVYDATNTATASLFGNNGVLSGVDGETLTLAGAGTLAGKDVSPSQLISSLSGFTLTGNGSALASNYTLIGGTDAVAITPRSITVAALGANKVYDSTTGDAGATLMSSGVLAGDTVGFADASATFADKNVGNGKTVTVSGISATGADATDYSVNTVALTTANITPAALTIVGTVAASKIYDGTTAAALDGAQLSGVFSGDAVVLGNDTSGSFNTRNVGAAKPVVTDMAISGADAGNYILMQPTGVAANITPKPLSVTATGANKVYDGTTSDPVTLASNGIITGDSLAFTSTSANFATPTVGNGKTVTVAGISATGADAGDYTLTNTTVATTADITPAAGIQDTAVAVGYLEAAPTAIATPYGVAPSDSPGALTGNEKMVHRPVEPNRERQDFVSGLSLRVVDGGVRAPAEAP